MNSYVYLSVVGLLVCSVYGTPIPFSDDEWVKMTKIPPTRIQHTFGSSVELECIAMGSPPPSIQWVVGDKPMKSVSSLKLYSILSSAEQYFIQIVPNF